MCCVVKVQVARHACALPTLHIEWELKQFQAAAQLVAAAAATCSIPPGHALHAAASLGLRIIHWEISMAGTPGADAANRAGFAELFGMCMYLTGSAAMAAAESLAVGGGHWQQDAADDLLSVVMQLCSWLLSDTAAVKADQSRLVQQNMQQQVALLLSDRGPAPSALAAASAGHRTDLAKHLANWVRQALQRDDLTRLPPLGAAAQALRMLCDAGGSAGEPLSASCLHTTYGKERLLTEVRVLPS